jgi:hypothetical protein
MAQVEELKSIVLQTLDGKGVLAKLRAQLRQHVYEAISEVPQEDGAAPPPAKMLEGEDTQLLIGVIADFLKAYDLTHTLSVLCVETGYPKSTVLSDRFRQQLADKLASKTRPEDPVLKAWYEKLERPSTNPQQGNLSRPSTNPQQGDFRSTFNDGPTESVSLGERVSLDDPSDQPERESMDLPSSADKLGSSVDKLGSSQTSAKSMLGDLPSLTTKPKSSLLGDLPPMGAGARGLAPLSSDDPLLGSRSKAPALAPLSKDADDTEEDKKKLQELDAQLQKIETTQGAARSDALSEAVSKQTVMKNEQDDTLEDDIPESVKSESEEFEEESISGGESGKSVDLGGQSQMEESSANVFGRDVSINSMDESLDHAESVEG